MKIFKLVGPAGGRSNPAVHHRHPFIRTLDSADKIREASGPHDAVCVLVPVADTRSESSLATATMLRKALPPEAALLLCGPTEEDARFWGADGVVDLDGPSDTILVTCEQAWQGRRRRTERGSACTERRVLVVDDDLDVLGAVAEGLRRSGFRVRTATHAAKALELLRERPVHVLLSDLRMPGMDGLQLVGSARRYDPSIVPVMLTGYPDIEAVIGALRLGAADFVVKPVAPGQLTACIEKAWTTWALGSPSAGPRAAAAAAGPKGPVRVLHVEDDDDDGLLMAEALGAASAPGFEVTRATSLLAAMDALQRGAFDVILSDLGLPDCVGLETCVRLRVSAPTVPVIVVTGNEDPETGEQALLCGVEAYIAKSALDTEPLVTRIRYAIECRRLVNRLEAMARDLHASYTCQRHALEHNSDAVFIVDASGIVRFANAAASELLQRPPGDIVDEPFDWPLTDERSAVRTVSRLGIETSLEMRCNATTWRGRPASVVSLRDVTSRVRDEEALRRLNSELLQAKAAVEEMARFDPLTGLLNRRGFEKVLFDEVGRAKRTGDPLAALIIDCDDFKHVNDSYGHNVGDAVLKQVAETIAATVRPGDYAARIGGDEFLILCPATRLAEAWVVADRVRNAVSERPLVIGAGTLRQTVSAGLAEVAAGLASIEELLARTHRSLRTSKAEGKNRVTSPTLPAGGPSATLSAVPIVDALCDPASFTAFAQPIVATGSREVTAVELLARSAVEFLGGPADFFAAARDHNLLTTVDLNCLRACLAVSASVPARHSVHINLLPSTLIDVGVRRLLELFPHPFVEGRYCIELCEQQFIGDPSYLRDAVAELARAGVSVALDDVGFGRSSLEALIVLEPAVIKIDRSYIHGVASDPGLERRLRRLLKSVHALGAQTVAEGVERAADYDFVARLGVQSAQGYHLGRPAPLAQGASPEQRRSALSVAGD